ncbi:MAG: hypothetical protein L0154_00735 [Chloroflexi bacterium]|nr:hypothetical protein [Chloroflexota bacterium]
MSDQTLIITNLAFKSPKRWQRGQGNRGLKATLKYIQFRDDRETAAPPDKGERWVNCGLGDNYLTIFQQCTNLKTDKVLAWTWVISPEPSVMNLLPADKRVELMKSLTETIVDRYHEERGFEPNYSYVVHDARTADGRPHTHSHVILPGMVQEHLGGQTPFVNYASRGHLQLLDDIAHQELEQLLEREVGLNWERPHKLWIE